MDAFPLNLFKILKIPPRIKKNHQLVRDIKIHLSGLVNLHTPLSILKMDQVFTVKDSMGNQITGLLKKLHQADTQSSAVRISGMQPGRLQQA